jgi:serine phosphatase RsbU (regulator of sigma subunit)
VAISSARAGRGPAGLGPGREFVVGEERLQPGDWLVLHSDGITEAHDSQDDATVLLARWTDPAGMLP